MPTRAKLAVILHADVVGSTRLVQIDEGLAHDRIQGAFNRLSRSIEAYGGIAHEIRGDALVAEFDRASDAVSAALAFQLENTVNNETIADNLRPTVRVGIALGEVIIADNTVTGAGVVLAQRLEQLAEPAGLCISAAVREALPARLPFEYGVLGEQKLKGFDEPVWAFSVALAERGTLPEPEAVLPRPAANNRNQFSKSWIVAVMFSCLLVMAGGIFWYMGWGETEKVELAAARGELTIAVRPFTNSSDDKSQDYFSDGISEDINTDLTKVASLTVTSAATMRRYSGEAIELKDISREIKARYILEGNVRRGENRLRISVQLYDAKADRQVWAERYDRDLKDLFAVQDDISARVVNAISAKLAVGTLVRQVRAYTPNVLAYDFYIRGRATRIPPTPANLAKASELFEQSIAVDPKFAGGYAGASVTNVLRYEHCAKSCDGLSAKALELANKAVDLDPTFGPSYGSLAEVLFRRGELKEALVAIQKAVDAAPNAALMRANYGRILGHSGRYEEGLQQVKQALVMSPYDLPLLYYLGAIYRVAGRFDKAIDALTEHRKRLGGQVLPAPTAQLAASYMQSGRESQARAEVGKLLQVAPHYFLELASRSQGFQSKEDSDKFLDALRYAGVPEG